jgi:hypothetical protein
MSQSKRGGSATDRFSLSRQCGIEHVPLGMYDVGFESTVKVRGDYAQETRLGACPAVCTPSCLAFEGLLRMRYHVTEYLQQRKRKIDVHEVSGVLLREP